MPKQSLVQKLKQGPGAILCAEGYLFQMEHRGYLKAGAYVPEVVIEHPEVVTQLHHEFARCGTDVQVAFTYYAHREKLKTIGRETDLEAMNRQALRLAKAAAAETDAYLAGNICNTGAYDMAQKAASVQEVRRQYTEQVKWAAEAGVDFVIAETLEYLEEALIALEVIQARNLPAVITFTTNLEQTKDGYSWVEACRILKKKGAEVVGFNCGSGPLSLLPLLRKLRQTVEGPIAALPVAYHTTLEQPSFQQLSDNYTLGLEPFLCTRQEMADFAAQAKEIGVEYIGMCCGGEPYHLRAMAEALGRTTEASKYSPDMSQHYLIGSDKYAKKYEQSFTQHFGGKHQ